MEKHWLNKITDDFKVKSRYELSKETNIRETTLSNIVNRNTKIQSVSIGVVARLAEGLGVSIDELYSKYKDD